MRSQVLKIVSNTAYAIGTALVLMLLFRVFFGSEEIANTQAMLPLCWQQLAFVWLAFGSVPMLAACVAVWRFNNLKNSAHPKRTFALVFLPGIISGGCLLYIFGVIAVGFVRFYCFS
jgi:hypothetical protein